MRETATCNHAIPSAFTRARRNTGRLALTCLMLAIFTGCNSFGNAKLVQELRNENERLLAEFRAERDRREEAERAQKKIENRLAESEKLLAQKYGNSSTNRLSSLPRYEQQESPGWPGVGMASPQNGDTGVGETVFGTADALRWQRRNLP